MKIYDAIVIGSGQGGLPLVRKFADMNWNVAMVESGKLGGSCINYGCTPTKTMLSSARVAHIARLAPSFGIHTGAVEVNMTEVVKRKNGVVNSFRSGLESGIESRPFRALSRARSLHVIS